MSTRVEADGLAAYKGRKTAAHFLIHNLGMDWRIGAFHDEEVLFDYDCAMNYGNWGVVAKIGNGGSSAWDGSRGVDVGREAGGRADGGADDEGGVEVEVVDEENPTVADAGRAMSCKSEGRASAAAAD